MAIITCKALTKQSRKLSHVENLHWLVTPFGHDLHVLAMACNDFRSRWSSSNLHASEQKFFIIWPPNTIRRKLASVLFPLLHAGVQGCTEMAYLLLALNLHLLASPFGHPSQVCARNFTFPNMHWLVTLLGQGLRLCGQLATNFFARQVAQEIVTCICNSILYFKTENRYYTKFDSCQGLILDGIQL